MGTIKQGILGGFSGKVGPVVGSSWKGIAYIRALALHVNDPNTILQQQVRAKFGLLSSFFNLGAGFFEVSFRNQSKSMTGVNAAIKYNFDQGVSGVYPNYSINYASLVLSKGSLTSLYNPSATTDSGVINVSWTDNTGIAKAKENDLVMAYLYNSVKKEPVYFTNLAKRSDASCEIEVPTAWSGDTVQLYLVVNSEDGQEASNSAYMGSINI